MSMISEQVKKINAIALAEECLGRIELSDTLREAADTILEISKKLAQANMERSEQYYGGGWIPCSERLPEKYGDYLVTWRRKGWSERYIEIVEYDPLDDEKWIGDIPQAEKTGHEILAWMELPHPYKEDKS